MAFEQGVYSDVHDLANRIRLFAVANGWIQDKYTVGSGTGTDSELYLHKGSNYVSIDFFIEAAALKWYHNIQQTIEEPSIHIYGNTGFNTLNAVDAQPGSHFTDTARRCLTQWVIGPCVQYFFFTNATGDYIHVAIEVVPNEYVYLMFGTLIKQGAYTGGAYVAGHRWKHFDNISDWDSDNHHVPFDANTRDIESFFSHVRTGPSLGTQEWHLIQQIDVPFGFVIGDVRHEAHNSWVYLENTYAGIPPMSSINLYYYDVNGHSYALGHVPDLRNANIRTLAPAETINLGADSWLLFPLARKGDPLLNDTITMNSGYTAFALKKIV